MSNSSKSVLARDLDECHSTEKTFFSVALVFTKKDLASKILVTDKAVSKWERGLGFPDINTIEPLADALDVSIGEIMKSERSVDET